MSSTIEATAAQAILGRMARGEISSEDARAQLEVLKQFWSMGTQDQAASVRETVQSKFAGDRDQAAVYTFFSMLATGRVNAGMPSERKAETRDIKGAAQRLMAGNRFHELAGRFDEVLTEFPGLSFANSIAQALARSPLVDVVATAAPPVVGHFIRDIIKAFGHGGFQGVSAELAKARDNKVIDGTLKFLKFIGADTALAKALESPIGKIVGNLGLSLMEEDKERVTQQVTGIYQTVFEYVAHALKRKHPDTVDTAGAVK